ncbi:hypothetical protein Smic_51570 [Streptomyces microflavus]|uniref:Intein C-terminal splicing domain-containing protein n=2 Tax=Streptomyces griseus group TaxID=629295 RepID=A0A7J0CVN4_STRMI|nr:hypothetical protein Smic_51570 [Streptomyces microflavus]
MADGTAMPIEEVEAGDKVLATDPETGKSRAETVTAEIRGDGSKDLVYITLAASPDSDSKPTAITATDGHPFWVPEAGEWVDAKDLIPGQRLQTSAGGRTQIAAIDRWTQDAAVYNLTISNLHTYYVLAGVTPVLVHNSGGCPDLDALSQSGMRPAKGKTTHAGREYQKHMNRGDLPVVPGKELKTAGQDLLDDILTNPQTATSAVNSGNFAGGTRYIMPDSAGGRGIGATFDANGQFQYFGRY